MTDSQTIRELERRLAASEGSADVVQKITSLNDLAWALSDTKMQRAYALSETAYTLASSPHDGTSPDQAGMAYSLRTQGYINQRLGDYPRGMTQLLKAQGLFESLGIEDGLADVLDGLAGIYAQIGDFPEALSYMYKQLDVAQRIGDQRRAANAYNNLGSIYLEFADYNRAIETFQHNLRLAGEIDDGRIICLSIANLSQVHLLAGDGSKALENGLYALRVCREMGFGLFEAYALDLIGKSYRALGTPAQAIPYLEQALALSTRLESKVVEPLVLLSLGEVYRDMQQLDRALECLRQAVAIAQAIDARSELSKGHFLLSEIYQQQGDLASALHHFKEYQAWREKVFNEKADQRLKVLQVAHDTETAKREAEILRLKAQQLEQEIIEQRKLDEALRLSHDDLERQVTARTAELNDTVALLRQEIADRLRAEAEVEQMVETLEQRVAARTEELATFFDLILLAGQGIGLSKILDQVLPQVIEVTRSEAVGIDLLDADRSALILVAKENFPKELPARLPVEELPPEFQRWLEGPNDPLSMRDVESMPSLLSAFRSVGLQSYLGAQIRIGDRTEGVLSCFRFTEHGYSADETALILALAHQIGLILEIDRLRTDAEAIAVLEERQRLARDLHDSVTQSLYSLSLFSRAGREAAEDGDADRLNRSLTELERNTLHALREMRLLLYELRPADLEQVGLIRAIELRLNAVERRANLQLDVRLDELGDISSVQEVELYHIIVEALNNVVKHAAATRVALHLTQADGYLHLRIADDGQGFDPAHARGGMGLRNIRERVARLDGQLTVISEPDAGTRLEAVIPCRMEEDR
jgi:signal transduction histidine kinase/tetratricopeptide (TPR) repeat protein